MKRKHLITILMIFTFAMTASGCGNAENYGEPISGKDTARIKDILTDPAGYDGKTVAVKGNIAIECETGCWFNFKDGDAVIYVDLEPSGFAIPQKGGHNAIVEGKVTIKNGKPVLIGKGVRIR